MLRCTFQRDTVEFTRLAHPLGQMCRRFRKISSFSRMNTSNIQICIVLLHLSSESGLRHPPKCGGEVVVLGTRLLSGSAHGCYLLNLRESEEQNEMLEAENDEEKESEADREVEERESQSTYA